MKSKGIFHFHSLRLLDTILRRYGMVFVFGSSLSMYRVLQYLLIRVFILFGSVACCARQTLVVSALEWTWISRQMNHTHAFPHPFFYWFFFSCWSFVDICGHCKLMAFFISTTVILFFDFKSITKTRYTIVFSCLYFSKEFFLLNLKYQI